MRDFYFYFFLIISGLPEKEKKKLTLLPVHAQDWSSQLYVGSYAALKLPA